MSVAAGAGINFDSSGLEQVLNQILKALSGMAPGGWPEVIQPVSEHDSKIAGLQTRAGAPQEMTRRLAAVEAAVQSLQTQQDTPQMLERLSELEAAHATQHAKAAELQEQLTRQTSRIVNLGELLHLPQRDGARLQRPGLRRCARE